jgi:hypothetical protein
MLADTPPNLGSESFRLGLGAGLGGAQAFLVLGPDRAVPGASYRGVPLYVDPSFASVRSFVLTGSAPGEGAATFHARLPGDPALVGTKTYAQWFVLDPGAISGLAVSAGAEFELFSRSWRPKARR